MRKDQVFSLNGTLISEVIVPFTEDEIRAERDRLLAETDYLALSDNTMSAAMTTYRQALRDITGQAGFPYSVTWPTKP